MTVIEGQVCLITGCSSGVGHAAALSLARAGATVVASMRGVEGGNSEAAGELRRMAGQEALRLEVAELDVTDDGSVQRAVDDVLARHGQVDVLVNNAGYGLVGPIEAISVEELHALYQVNVYGALRCCRAVLPSMRARGSGLLIHVSSVLGRMACPANGAYASSKWALEALALTLRYELAPLGVDSVVVEPGTLGTRFSPRVRQPADMSRRAAYAAMTEPLMDPATRLQRPGRVIGDPQIVADAVAALIETPRGKRPAQVIVGHATEGLADYNRTLATLHERLIKGMEIEQALGNGA